MKRRNLLKALSSAIALPLVPKKDVSNPESFVPDVVIGPESPFAQYIKVYLDGVKQLRCFGLRIKWESFERPTEGILIVQADDEDWKSRVICRLPREGEFEEQGIWVKAVKGQVFVTYPDECREEVYKIIASCKSATSK